MNAASDPGLGDTFDDDVSNVTSSVQASADAAAQRATPGDVPAAGDVQSTLDTGNALLADEIYMGEYVDTPPLPPPHSADNDDGSLPPGVTI